MFLIYYFNYLLCRCLALWLSLLPRRVLFFLGKKGGTLLYYCHREFRKKAMTSLSIAFGSKYSEKELKRIAKASFQNLGITCLEFLAITKRIDKYVEFEGGDEIISLLEKKQGVVFFSAHQANWEIPFLSITPRFPGVAIGRPVKNKWLYNWVLSQRERFGGKIVSPKHAIKAGLQALQEGKFIGIVGDQAFPQSPYSYPLFGTRAWTSTSPALLACRAKAPLVAITTKRKGLKYVISGSKPFFPDPNKPLKDEVPRLMDLAMHYHEKSIENRPEEWLWQHDRWKQHGVGYLKREFRFAFILVILPPDPTLLLPNLPLFQKIYSRGFITYLAPDGTKISNALYYKTPQDLFLPDWRYQIVFDFYDSAKLRRHFRKRGAFKTLTLDNLKKISKTSENFSEILIKALCKHDAPRSLFY